MGNENRQHPRVEIKWPIVLATTRGNIFGQTIDLSLGGALVRSLEKPILVGTFQLVLKPKGRQGFITLNAKEVWVNTLSLSDDTPVYGVGLRFTDIFADDRRFLCSSILERLR